MYLAEIKYQCPPAPDKDAELNEEVTQLDKAMAQASVSYRGRVQDTTYDAATGVRSLQFTFRKDYNARDFARIAGRFIANNTFVKPLTIETRELDG